MPPSPQPLDPPPASPEGNLQAGNVQAGESWWLFRNEVETFQHRKPQERRERTHQSETSPQPSPQPWPEPPPWRRFRTPPEPAAESSGMNDKYWSELDSIADSLEREKQRGLTFKLPRGADNKLTRSGERILLAVNAAIRLRRPLLVTGLPGSGKTSLAYAIATELGLGPVLVWAITPRSRLLEDGLYRYDALARLQQADLDRTAQLGAEARQPPPIDRFLRLGPVGTAFLPSRWPRVLLIDEIDKGDLQLPSELLHLFEEGRYEITELTRARSEGATQPHEIRTADAKAEAESANLLEVPLTVELQSGFVRCQEFPIVVMTSNREREFPPAFHRRCIRVGMPPPDEEALSAIVAAHFSPDSHGAVRDPAELRREIQTFLGLAAGDAAPMPTDRAVDQLLNAWFLLTRESPDGPTEAQRAELRRILYRNLSDRSEDPQGPGSDDAS